MSGHRPGIAVLHGYDPASGQTSVDVFEEKGDADDSPYHRAVVIRDSVAPDFPGWLWSIGYDRRAHYLLYAHNMRGIGLDAESYDEWDPNR